MVELIKDTSNKTYEKNTIDKKLLLSSLRDFYPDGVVMGVERILKSKKNLYDKFNIYAILSIVGDMPKARQYVLNDEGEYVMCTDPKTGEVTRDIELKDATFAQVFFPFYAKVKDEEIELNEETKLLITPGTSSYSFFKEGFISAGLLPKDMSDYDSFVTSFAEIEQALTGFEFKGCYGCNSYGGKKFDYLECHRISKDDFVERVIED